ncbi:MAG: hypothetical protein ACI8UO_004850 [Verrucomicrobiales bacterium]|jgi:uncharacterized protein YcfJ
MKKQLLITSLAIFAAFALSSCGGYGPQTKRGAANGALLGGAAGAVIGNQSDRPLEGAAIGAVAGALLGGSYGSANDDDYRERRSRGNRRYQDDGYREGGRGYGADPEAEYDEGYEAGRRAGQNGGYYR